MSIDFSALTGVAGFINASLVDSDTGLIVASTGDGKDLDALVAANTEIVKAKNRTMATLGQPGALEDILITLGDQYQLIRPLSETPSLFISVSLSKRDANLGLARVQVRKLEQSLNL